MARQTSTALSNMANRRLARPDVTGGRTTDLAPVDASLGDRFFRQLVLNLRTGVLAITRDGRIAAMNDMGYRVLGLTPRPGDLGRPYADVLQDCPEVMRVLQSAF